jgi:hypothetical protein
MVGWLGVVVKDYVFSTPTVKGGEFQVQGQPGLHCEFKASLSHIDHISKNQGQPGTGGSSL